MYVGFFAARLATVVVRNIRLAVSSREADTPGVLPPPERTAPTLEILSLPTSSAVEYELIAKSNVAGSVTVKQGKEVLAARSRKSSTSA
jgi:hypothetical protein